MHRSIADPGRTDIAIVPSLLVPDGVWVRGRYPELVAWLQRVHEEGALLCSACSGVLLIAETGLLAGRSVTIHPAYAPTFRDNYPDVGLRLDEVLVATGEREELVMSGASAVLARPRPLPRRASRRPDRGAGAGEVPAAAVAHRRPGPYVPFDAPLDHGDAIVAEAQEWLRTHYAVAAPVTELVERSGLPERTFKRRFTAATGHSPIAYVQHVRVEEAKRRLERTAEPVDAISYAVGYEDPASFRRLFKRITGVTRAYRRKLQLPRSRARQQAQSIADPIAIASRR